VCDEPGVFARTVRIQEYDPTLPLPIGDATVTFAPAVHDLPSWAIRVDAGGSAFGYTGDTGPAADLTGFFHGVNVLVAEATLLAPGDRCFTERGSLTAGEAGALRQAAAVESLVLSHLWEELGFEPAAEHASSAFAGPLLLAQPGLSAEW
jgi:ribonuclease BN (tRNA processing enzyme)